jgi:hypothetical protein
LARTFTSDACRVVSASISVLGSGFAAFAGLAFGAGLVGSFGAGAALVLRAFAGVAFVVWVRVAGFYAVDMIRLLGRLGLPLVGRR